MLGGGSTGIESKRRFDVTIQGCKILENFDVIKESGGQDPPVVREFRGIMVKDDLKIDFAPSKKPNKAPLIYGVEVTARSVPAMAFKNVLFTETQH